MPESSISQSLNSTAVHEVHYSAIDANFVGFVHTTMSSNSQAAAPRLGSGADSHFPKLAKLDKALLTKGSHRQITAFFVCPNALFHASPAVGRRFAC